MPPHSGRNGNDKRTPLESMKQNATHRFQLVISIVATIVFAARALNTWLNLSDHLKTPNPERKHMKTQQTEKLPHMLTTECASIFKAKEREQRDTEGFHEMADAPAQVQHSPQTADQWFAKASDVINDDRNRQVEDYRTHEHSPAENAAIAHMKELRAHAQRLADALKLTLDALFNETANCNDSPWITDVKRQAREVLADWIAQ